MRSPVRPLVSGVALVALVACGTTAPPALRAAAPAPVDSATMATTAPRVTKVLTVVLENHGTAATLRGMPRLAALAARYGRTTHYRALTHPSLPNYLALAGGSTSGVRDDRSPSAHLVHGPSVFDLALAAGHTAGTYAEGMPAPCSLTASGRYAVKHDPWAYYADAASRRGCRAHDLPAGTPTSGALARDVAAGALPDVGLLVPDLCHDAHDCPLATADAWLASWTAAVQRGADWRAGRLALVVTFDEDESHGDNTVLTVVAAPSLTRAVATRPLTHLSWTRWMADLAGVRAPRDAATAPSLGAAFGL